jgi:hypothetical protein
VVVEYKPSLDRHGRWRVAVTQSALCLGMDHCTVAMVVRGSVQIGVGVLLRGFVVIDRIAHDLTVGAF